MEVKNEYQVITRSSMQLPGISENSGWFLNKVFESQPVSRKKVPERTQDREFNGDRRGPEPTCYTKADTQVGRQAFSVIHIICSLMLAKTRSFKYGQGLFNNTYPTHVPEQR